MQKFILAFAMIVAVAVLAVIVDDIRHAGNTATAGHSSDPEYRVSADHPRLNRKVMGPVTASVQGVPAEPVHSFVWDGEGSEPVKGRITIEVNPVDNSGRIVARWTDRNGRWELTQTAFAPPPHPTGLRIGSSGSETEYVVDDPIVTDVYLHGDTGAAGPVLPTVFNSLATWGPAEVKLNGQTFENPFDGPAPLWVAHTMVTEGVRDADGQVTANAGDDIYNPTLAGQGDTDDSDREVHLVWHDAPGPETTDNFPPPLSFFYHLTFEDVDVSFTQAD